MAVVGRSRRLSLSNGASLHLVEWGQPSETAVVMSHGIRAYAHWFDDLAGALADRWHVVAYDVRGRGSSDWSPTGDYSVDFLADDLEDIVDSLDVARVALVGHSLGGQISLNYTGRHPERVAALVLLDAGVQPKQGGTARMRSEMSETPAGFESWEDAERFVRLMHPSVSDARTVTRLEWMLTQEPDGSVRWRLDPAILRGGGLGYPPERRWRAIRRATCPTLILRGDRSDFLAEEDCDAMVAALPPGSSCTTIPNAGHMVLDDNPAACCEAIPPFLARAVGGR